MRRSNRTIAIAGLAALGIALFLINLYTVNSTGLTLLALIITVGFPAALEYMEYRKMLEIEDRFPDFLRDVAQSIRAGMTLPQAIDSLKDTDYGALSPYVRRMAIKIDWGLSFESVLEKFSASETPVVRRTVATIIEAHEGGGNIADVLSSVGNSINQINRIKKERQNAIYSQMVTGYIIFFVFLGVIVALKSYLIPSLSSVSSPELGVSGLRDLEQTYGGIFTSLIIIQGFFSGLVIGKMSEGKIIGGLKHSIVLMIVGYLVLSLL